MPIRASTRRYLDSHLQQAEFTLKVASNFACLVDTPALESIRAALGNIGEARKWVSNAEGTMKPRHRKRRVTSRHER